MAALPSDLRQQSGGYVFVWSSALIAPQGHWQASGSSDEIQLAQSALHILEGYARDVERMRPRTAMRGHEAIAALQTMAAGWRDFFQDDTDLGIDPDGRDQLLGELEQLLWLLQRANLYGVPLGQARRVVQRGTELTPQVRPNSHAKVWGMVIAGTAILHAITGGVQDLQSTVDVFAGTTDTLECEIVKNAALDWTKRCIPPSESSRPQVTQRERPKLLGPGREAGNPAP